MKKTTKWPFSFNEDWSGWGWSVFIAQLIIAFGFLIFSLVGLFGLPQLAFAARQPGAVHYSSQQSVQSMRLQVSGVLSWTDGIAQIEDQDTGAVYRLSNSDEVKSLYDQGVRKVSVSGTLTRAASTDAMLQVESMAALR